MVYVESLGIYVNRVEDLRDKVSEDLFEAIEYLTYAENEDLEDSYENLKCEFEAYELNMEHMRSGFNEILDLTDKFDNELNDLYDYVSDTKRINREKILDTLKKIEVELISNIIKRRM